MKFVPADGDARRATRAVVPGPSRGIVVRWYVAVSVFVAGTSITAVGTGIPTELIPNPWFTRMTSIQGYAYPVWAVSAVLTGALLALYLGVVRTSCRITRGERPAGAVGVASSFLAVGCPVCNKLVVALIGATGATTYFAPIQPVLAAVSLVLLGGALALRVRALIRP